MQYCEPNLKDYVYPRFTEIWILFSLHQSALRTFA